MNDDRSAATYDRVVIAAEIPREQHRLGPKDSRPSGSPRLRWGGASGLREAPGPGELMAGKELTGRRLTEPSGEGLRLVRRMAGLMM